MRERGLKLSCILTISVLTCRSREGAWIEMVSPQCDEDKPSVAPVRERGLKCVSYIMKC